MGAFEALQSHGILSISIAVILLLIALVLYRSLVSAPRGHSIVLVGPCDAGKTTLFLQLRDGTVGMGTVASMQPNEADIRLKSDKPNARLIHVVDVPGHPRLRNVFDSQVNLARGIIFLVDSVDFMKSKKTDAAEQLYDVITHPVVAGRRLPVLLACNKQDAGNKAHTPAFMRKTLEKELDTMRATRGALGGDAIASRAASLMGMPGSVFSFEALEAAGGPKVVCVGIAAIETGGVEEVERFLRRCVPS